MSRGLTHKSGEHARVMHSQLSPGVALFFVEQVEAVAGGTKVGASAAT
jgi:hypothetical protein